MRVGDVPIGGGHPVVVQSMTTTRTVDIAATVRQIRRLERAGCEVVRVAVPDAASAEAVGVIRRRIGLPLVADVHFDHRLAVAAIEAGADKVRINPGNIGASWKVKRVIRAADEAGIPIRVGVNAGSLDRRLLRRYRRPGADALVAGMEAALGPFEQLGFRAVVLSAKATDGPDTIAACRALAREYRYPLHLGLTEAGLRFEGAVRSAAVLGVLLAGGIGDTIRVSLSGDPVPEVIAAYELLRALGVREHGPAVYSCPTCGRAEVDVERLAARVSRALRGFRAPIKVAVMGCVVNGPGEARDADYGVAGGRKKGAIFARGKIVKTCPDDRIVEELVREIARNES